MPGACTIRSTMVRQGLRRHLPPSDKCLTPADSPGNHGSRGFLRSRALLIRSVSLQTYEAAATAVGMDPFRQMTLAGLFVDYVDHLEHHLRKMLGGWESGAT